MAEWETTFLPYLYCVQPQSGCNKCLSLFLADDNATIRVTNLSEDTRETDLQELFRPFGSISRIYLAKDKNTGQSKVSGADWLFSSALGPIIQFISFDLLRSGFRSQA